MFQDGFPSYLKDDVAKVIGMIPHKTYNNVTIGVSEDTVQYFQDNQLIRFPYRIYHIDRSDEIKENVSQRQKMILHCIYSRSCDGFVRQKHMYSLLETDYEDWAIPYIVKICDEYVVEIVEMTYDVLKDKNTDQIKRFCSENIVPLCKSYHRMVSYWNEFYRYEYTDFQQYIGRKLFRDCFGYSKSMERRAKENSKISHVK
jgi:hypothetical protein